MGWLFVADAQDGEADRDYQLGDVPRCSHRGAVLTRFRLARLANDDLLLDEFAEKVDVSPVVA